MEGIGIVNIPPQDVTCSGCATRVKDGLASLKGVKEVTYQLWNDSVSVQFDPFIVTAKRIEEEIERLGFRLANKEYPSFWNSLSRRWRGKGV